MRVLGRLTAFHEVSTDRVSWQLAAAVGLIPGTTLPTEELPAGLVASPTSSPQTEEPNWYYLDTTGERHGPLRQEEFVTMIGAGRFQPTSEVWREGFADWVRLGQTELASFLPKIPTTQPVIGEQGSGNAVVVAGYICCVAALFVCPFFGVLALACSVANLGKGRVAHGLVLLFLAIVLTAAGCLLAYLVWQEFATPVAMSALTTILHRARGRPAIAWATTGDGCGACSLKAGCWPANEQGKSV